MIGMRGLISSWWFILCSGAIVIVLTHFLQLTALPVFADEAIYIRWAQLIISDPAQYWLFPLNDGKTPLYIWQLVPALALQLDPLWTARAVSVLGGVIQMGVLVCIAKQMGWGKAGAWFGVAIVTVSPFWFFHHRMALMDGWLAVWISIGLLGLIGMQQQLLKECTPSEKLVQTSRLYLKKSWQFGLLTAVAVCAGLLTKTPMLLAVPALALTPLLFHSTIKRDVLRIVVSSVWISLGMLLASSIILTPSGPQLFARGGDFLLPIGEVLTGRWQETIPSIPTHWGYFISYLGWGVLISALLPLFVSSVRRQGMLLWLQAVLFMAPIWLLGKMVFPRYLFPATVWITLLAMLGFSVVWQVAKKRGSILLAPMLLLSTLVMLIGFTSARFLVPAFTDTGEIPFNQPDGKQYLGTWSSGHGVRETYASLEKWSATHPRGELLVVTEGRFGTLPDGLLLYNFNHPLDRVWIEGTGFTGLHSAPVEIKNKVAADATIWLVVNSDRLDRELPPELLIAEYCRPVGLVCLQVWDVTRVE